MIDLNTALMGLIGLLGTAALAHLGAILYGRVGKQLFLYPLTLLAKLTKSKKDDRLVEDAKKDLGISEEPNKEK